MQFSGSAFWSARSADRPVHTIPDTDDDGIAFFERHWTKLRGDRQMPTPEEIDPMDFPRFLPCVFLLDGTTLDRLVVRLAGTFYRELYGIEITGHRVADLIPFDRTPDILDEYRTCLERGRLVYHSGQVTWRSRGSQLTFHRILMPFGRDGRVSRLMGFAEFKYLA